MEALPRGVPDGPPRLELYDHGTDPGEFVSLVGGMVNSAPRALMRS